MFSQDASEDGSTYLETTSNEGGEGTLVITPHGDNMEEHTAEWFDCRLSQGLRPDQGQPAEVLGVRNQMGGTRTEYDFHIRFLNSDRLPFAILKARDGEKVSNHWFAPDRNLAEAAWFAFSACQQSCVTYSESHMGDHQNASLQPS